jgi:hypothetical protein
MVIRAMTFSSGRGDFLVPIWLDVDCSFLLTNHERFGTSDMKRLFHLGKTRIPFMVCLCATFALTALVVAKAPPRHLSASGATKTARTSSAGATEVEGTQVTAVDPFVGTNSETWEEFGVHSIPSGTSILGGIATISGPAMVTQHSFQLCSVFAVPSDGTILMAQDRPQDTVTISFSQPVLAFGAYWGTGTSCIIFPDAETILTFQDVNGNVIGSDSFPYRDSGPLAWAGYAFATPVKTITRTASDGQEGFAIDGLQATVASSGGNSTLLSNISTRAFVQTGDNVLIGGFIITGTQPKRVIVRAIGPSLSSFFPDALANPVLELRDSSGALIQSNDNWRSTQEAEIIATGVAPSNNLEAAIVAILPASNSAYTAIVHGVNNGTGVGVVEAYDLDRTVDAKLANISTRGFVQTGDNVLIGGLIVVGQNPLRVIVRAIGPSLTGAGALANPALELYDINGALIASNDNWRSDQEAEIIATGVPPSNDLESAIVRDLAPGNYTAIVHGVSGTTGIALVEAFGLN